jgi:hypothetical protein
MTTKAGFAVSGIGPADASHAPRVRCATLGFETETLFGFVGGCHNFNLGVTFPAHG